MGFLDSVKAWFRTETAEAKDVGRGLRDRMDADLSRREAELEMTPEERLDQLTESIEGDTSLDDLRSKIEGREALAEATADVAGIDAEQRAAADDVLDLESEEIVPPEPPPAH